MVRVGLKRGKGQEQVESKSSNVQYGSRALSSNVQYGSRTLSALFKLGAHSPQ
jgi:hypothetical protein